MARYDVLGNIVIVKFGREEKLRDKKKFAEEFLKLHKNIETVLEKSDKFKGRLRTQSTKWIAGEKNKEVLYRENGCVFRMNVDSCYFSPRLSTDRLDVAGKIKKGENVLVMFGGVAPYAIVIAKHSKAKKIVSVELGRECSKYASENVKRNKLTNVETIQGNVRKTPLGVHQGGARHQNPGGKVFGEKYFKKIKFDRIMMARPNLKDSFLDVAFSIIKKNGTIHYHGFYHEDEKAGMLEMIKSEAEKAGKKIRILKVKKACDIGIRRWRYRVDFKVLN